MEVVEISRDQVSVFVDEVIRNALSAYQMEVVAQKRRKAQDVSSHIVPRGAFRYRVSGNHYLMWGTVSHRLFKVAPTLKLQVVTQHTINW